MPADTAVTTPVVEPIVAMPVALLLHVPPLVVLVNVNVALSHIGVVPNIGCGLMVIVTLPVIVNVPNVVTTLVKA